MLRNQLSRWCTTRCPRIHPIGKIFPRQYDRRKEVGEFCAVRRTARTLSPQTSHGRKVSAICTILPSDTQVSVRQLPLQSNLAWKIHSLFLSFLQPSIQEIIQIVILLFDFLWLHRTSRWSCLLVLAFRIVGVKIFQLHRKTRCGVRACRVLRNYVLVHKGRS